MEANPFVVDDLVALISRHTQGLTDCDTAIDGLTFFRREAPMPPTLCLIEPSIVLVVQGEKRMLVGDEAYPYDVGHFLVTALDLPANSQVLVASPDRPCLGLTLKLDLPALAEVIAQGHLPMPMPQSQDRGIGIGTMTPALLDPFRRLLNLLEEPEARPLMVPLVLREIAYRLLTSNQATKLWQIVSSGGPGNRIAEAIDWLKTHFAEDVRIADLASRVRMSPSSFHQHFRHLTAMSPLQYQKWLRLNEARRLMIAEHFGAPPRRDVSALLGDR